MKLTIFKGLCHDLAFNLDDHLFHGKFKDLPREVKTNVLEKKDAFDRYCADFFLERLPKTFDVTRVEGIHISIHRPMTGHLINIEVSVDGMKFGYKLKGFTV